MSKKIYHPDYVGEIIASRSQIEKAIKKAAKWINRKYAHCKKPPILLAVLKGAIPFYGRLVMDLKIECVFDFIVLSSFRGSTKAQNEPTMLRDLLSDMKNRDVIIVEDIVDTAKTLNKLISYIKTKNPKSVSTVCLVNKYQMRAVKFEPNYACFKLKGNPFLIGYGLDINEVARNLPYIATFNKKYIDKL